MKKIIDNCIIEFFKQIYKIQQNNKTKKINKIKSTILSGKICGKSYHAINGATLSIKEQNNKKEKIIQDRLEALVEEYIKQPEKFFEFINNANTQIHQIKFADKILSQIGEKEGFILPQKGIKALYLNLILNKKIDTETKEMFVLRNLNVNTYAFLYQFYNWYCFKMKLAGFETETQTQFKHIFEICETSKIDSLNYEEILNMKSAIKRDIEAIDFVKKMATKFAMSKKNLEKIKSGKTISI